MNPTLQTTLKSLSPSQPYQTSADDTLQLAEMIGMTFSGSPSILRGKIEEIINKQVQDWATNQS